MPDTTRKKILIVDDEATVRELVAAVAQVIEGAQVLKAENGEQAMTIARAEHPQLVISDVNMPGMDGLALCKALRSDPHMAAVPVLLLTARGQAVDKYEGFIQGADDYLAKPFDALELQLRIRALLRRTGKPAAAAPVPAAGDLAAGVFRLDPGRYRMFVEGREVALTSSELAIMRYLLGHPDRIITVQALLSEALDYPRGSGSPGTVHAHIKNIRNKLRAAGLDGSQIGSSKLGYSIDHAS